MTYLRSLNYLNMYLFVNSYVNSKMLLYHLLQEWNSIKAFHCVRSVRIRSFSGPYFPTFGLKTERYSVFSRIQTENGEILRISPYSVRMRENTDQKNSEYGHHSGSVFLGFKTWQINNTLRGTLESVFINKFLVRLYHLS